MRPPLLRALFRWGVILPISAAAILLLFMTS